MLFEARITTEPNVSDFELMSLWIIKRYSECETTGHLFWIAKCQNQPFSASRFCGDAACSRQQA